MERAELFSSLNLNKFIALDFETTGLQVDSDRIIEVAAILFEDGLPTKKYTTLVNPGIPIPGFIENITGITNSMVSDSPKEKDMVKDFFKFIGSYPIVAHNTPFDLSFLKSMATRYSLELSDRKYFDTLTLSRAFLYFQPAHNLSAVSDYFGFSTEGAHRAEYDTINCGKIFVELVEEIASYNLDLISRIISFLKPFNVHNKDLFIELGNILTKIGDLKNGLVESKIVKPSNKNYFIHNGDNDISDTDSYKIFGPDGELNRSFETYEHRPNQIEYSKFVDDLFSSSGGIGISEAGTGLGKSMAYLYPAIKHNAKQAENQPVIISCYTKHLQDQLFNKDLPRLTKAINTSINAVVMKGRQNYICKTRLSWLINSSDKMLGEDEAINLLPLIIWLEHTDTGDMDECPGFTNGFTFRLMAIVQSEQGFCTSAICVKNGGCYFGPLRKLVFQANIIVVNHALLISEGIARRLNEDGIGFLPDFQTVIIDEAHNLPQSTYHQLTSTLDQRSMLFDLDRIDPEHSHSVRWNNQIKSIGGIHLKIEDVRKNLSNSISSCRESLKSFFDQLVENNIHKYNPDSQYSSKLIIKDVAEEFSQLDSELELLNKGYHFIRNNIRKLRELLLDIDETREDFLELHQLLDRGEGSISDTLSLIQLITTNQQYNNVYWYEGSFKHFNGKTQLVITVNMSPIDLSEDLASNLFKPINHCLLTSATIRTDMTFDYYLNRTGLDRVEFDDVVTAVFESPFHYNDQVTYYQYSRSDGQSPETLASIIFNCHKRYNKRMMVLFTSRAQLESTYKLITQKKGGRDLPIFAQKRQTSRSGLVRGMHQSPNGILLGTNAFWEGVDLPGDLLEILIIVKMPFDVPTEPIVKAFGDLVEAQGGNRFMDYALPESVIRFRQGFGRLIRTTYDEGIFIVMDDRIVNKRYGTAFSDVVPVDLKRFSNLEDLS